MRPRAAAASALALACSAVGCDLEAQQLAAAGPCVMERVSGRVTEGQDFEAPVGRDLVFRLVASTYPPNPAGWTISITPSSSAASDYAMVATPPYRFANPRYVDTGYGVTAEAALAMTPRHFAFVASARDFSAAVDALDVLLWPGNHAGAEVDSARARMTALPTYPGSLVIEDGSASQPSQENPLGVIEQMSFRVDLCVPSGPA